MPMMSNERGDLDADTIINLHRGQQDGFGIYCRVRVHDIIVSAIERGSAAEKCGVQLNDTLVSVMDNDKRYPEAGQIRGKKRRTPL